MESEGILSALAEVGIAIAGFSGIVVALQHRSGGWPEIDKFRFNLLLQVSLVGVFSSLIPILLHLVNPGRTFVWAWSSGLWLAYALPMIVYRVPRAITTLRSVAEPWSRSARAYMFTSLTLQILLQTTNLVWLREPWPHVLTVLLSLFFASLLFVRLLHGVIGRPT